MSQVIAVLHDKGGCAKTTTVVNLGFALWYFNPFRPECRQFFPSEVGQFVIRIGKHCFYNPTEAYAET